MNEVPDDEDDYPLDPTRWEKPSDEINYFFIILLIILVVFSVILMYFFMSSEN